MSAFEYLPITPGPPLSRFVESLWFARGRMTSQRESIAPTGSTVAGLVLGSPISQTASGHPAFIATEGFLIGPHDMPIVNEPLAETFAVGIVTTPIGCTPLFGLEPAALRGRVFDLGAAWPAAAELRKDLLDLATRAAAPIEFLTVTESALLSGLNESVTGLTRVEAAVAALTSDATLPIADIAVALEVSHSYLDREFNRLVGLSPSVLARILRLRALLSQIDVYGTVEWTGLAADLGWFDQAHLIRDFKRHTGVTPSDYLTSQRAGYSPADAQPGFVPVGNRDR